MLDTKVSISGASMRDRNQKMNQKVLKLWPSTLSLLHECPRCFWLQHHAHVPRPRGMFSSLPNALDAIIKANVYPFIPLNSKPSWLLPELRGASVVNVPKLFYEKDGVTMSGSLDQLLQLEDGEYFIVDYKTSRHVYTPETAAKFYSLQMDCYALLCEENGFEPVETAYLVFFTPVSMLSEGALLPKPMNIFRFETTAIPIPVDSERARKVIAEAVEVVKRDVPPQPSPTCEYCNYVASLNEKLNELDAKLNAFANSNANTSSSGRSYAPSDQLKGGEKKIVE